MAKTPQQYYEELIANPKKQLEEKLTQRQQADAQQKAQINATVDQSVQNATAQYEQQIEALPAESRELYDTNALDAAVSRTRVQEYLANMGMTDSGLTSSMATALSVQKGKADRQVRMNEQQQRQSLMATIDQIVAEGEAKKAESAMSIDAATRQWYDETNARLEEAAQSSAASAYAADQEYAAKVLAEQVKAEQEAAKENAKLQQEYNDNRKKYMQERIAAGRTEKQAMADALAMYPLSAPADTNSQEYTDYVNTTLYYEGIRNGYSDNEAQLYATSGGGDSGATAVEDRAEGRARTLAKQLTRDISGWGTWLHDYDGQDGVYVAEEVESQLSNDGTYRRMSNIEKEFAKAYLIAMDVHKCWPSDEAKYNKVRIKIACDRIKADYNIALNFYEKHYT